MPERLLLGSADGYAYFSDADSAGVVEGGLFRMRVRSKAIAPAGPTGEAVFRRAYVTISSQAGYQVRVTPILDGIELRDCTMVFADRVSPPSGTPVTRVLEVPIMHHDPERGITYGARGTSLEVLIETEPVYLEVATGTAHRYALFGTVNIETVSVMFQPGSAGV